MPDIAGVLKSGAIHTPVPGVVLIGSVAGSTYQSTENGWLTGAFPMLRIRAVSVTGRLRVGVGGSALNRSIMRSGLRNLGDTQRDRRRVAHDIALGEHAEWVGGDWRGHADADREHPMAPGVTRSGAQMESEPGGRPATDISTGVLPHSLTLVSAIVNTAAWPMGRASSVA